VANGVYRSLDCSLHRLVIRRKNCGDDQSSEKHGKMVFARRSVRRMKANHDKEWTESGAQSTKSILCTPYSYRRPVNWADQWRLNSFELW
jgi:hypothetical protein